MKGTHYPPNAALVMSVIFVEQERVGTRAGEKRMNSVGILRLTKTAVAAVQVTLVGVDDTVTAAYWLVLFGAEARARTTFPGRSDTSFRSTYNTI